MVGPDYPVYSVLLANPERFVKVRFPVRHVNPSAPLGRTTSLFNPRCPSLRFAGPVQQFASIFSGRRAPRAPTLLVKQSHYRALGPLFQRPTLHPHRQRAVQFETPRRTDDPQTLGCTMPTVIQKGGVLDEQIVSGLAAGLASSFHMGRHYSLKAHSPLSKKTVGGFELGPILKSLRQYPTGTGGQMFGDIHQAFIATLIPQLGESKFILRPLSRWY